jgi:hypothetical protein
LNNETKGKGDGKGELGDLIGEDGVKNRIDQRVDDEIKQDENYAPPDREDFAKFWTTKAKDTIIAPMETDTEKMQIKDIYMALFNNAMPQVEEIMSQIKQDPNTYNTLPATHRDKALNESLRWGLSGINNESLGDCAMTNWQEYLVKFKGQDPKVVAKITKAARDAEGQNDPKSMAALRAYSDMLDGIYEEVASFEDGADPSQSTLMKFLQSKASEYMKFATDLHKSEQMLKQIQFKPHSDDLITFEHMAQAAAGCALREYRYKNIYSKGEDRSGSGTAIRRYAYLKEKFPVIFQKIRDVIQGKQKFVLFTDKNANVRKYFHMGKDGSFAVRTAVFDPQVTFPDEESLILHLSDPRNRVPGKPFDEPLNTMNWSTVSGMIDREEYMPKMLDRVQRTDVNGLKKQLSDVNFKPSKKATTPEQIAKEQEKFNKYNNLQNTLSEANANWLADPAANETKPGHPVPDRLRDYRIALGKHIQTVMAQHQVTPEMVIKAINDKKIRNGPRVSNPRSNQAWLQAILSGNPQPYSRSDFSTLAEGINLASPAKPQLNDAVLSTSL